MQNKKVSVINAVTGVKKSAKEKPKAPQKRGQPTKVKAVKNEKAKANPRPKLRVMFLGGLNEVGKNMTLFEYGDDMIIVDCGLAFPDQDMFGVDIVLPDFSFVEKNVQRIRGIFVTHGHEDHIGGIPYLLKSANLPIYGTSLTIGLITGKLKESGLLRHANLNIINPEEKITVGAFSVEGIHVNHSIPGAMAFAIRCKAGTVVMTGDFKIDSTPIDGDTIDLAKLAKIGGEKVLCLLSDSTNAERPGYTQSERKVGESFDTLFRRANGKRIIIATFASNIHRVQQIIDISEQLNKKVALSGRSLENVVSIAQELGYLRIPKDLMITIDQVKRYSDDELVIITTGSQGEPLSALSRMASSDHRKIEITGNDCVIISATPIPGNEKTVNKVINELMKLGAEVVYERMYDVHVSGHACQEELKILLGLLKPKFFIPVHGEHKHLRKHAQLALAMGVKEENVLIADNGNVIEFNRNTAVFCPSIPAGRVLVDGYGVGDVGSVVLRERKLLSQDGLIIVAAAVNLLTASMVSEPEILTRGFVYVKESEQLINEAVEVAKNTIKFCLGGVVLDIGIIKSRLREDLSKLMNDRTRRNPMVLPIIINVE